MRNLLSYCFPVLFLCAATVLSGQPVSGTIQGKVSLLSSGEAAAGVNVVVEQEGRFITARSTNSAGDYTVGRLPEGDYDIRFARKGIRIPNNLVVDVPVREGQITTLDARIGEGVLEADEPVLAEDTRGQPTVRVIEKPEEEPAVPERPSFESYDFFPEQGFIAVRRQPRSTFSADVDQAFYTIIQRMIRRGYKPPAGAVRIEEMLNYFPYEDPRPAPGETFSVTTERSACPWNEKHDLLRVGIRGPEVLAEDLPPSHLVFLVDVSGSMDSPDKLPLVRASLRLLTQRLRSKDRVSIVTYRDRAGIRLEPTPADQREPILRSIAGLKPGGATAGEAGLRMAYDLAREHFLPQGNNRIIVFTDGDFNVGPHSDEEIVTLIEELRNTGVYLSVLGYGSGNLKDSKLELLADKGNGHYAYVDNIQVAEKVLVDELGGTLLAIAKDLKIRLQFHPGDAEAYRLIGYENRLLSPKEFRRTKADAGEIGAGHQVVALYELIPASLPDPDASVRVDLRWKDPRSGHSRKLEHRDGSPRKELSEASDDFRFCAAVAEFGLILRNSPWLASGDITQVRSMAEGALGSDRQGYRKNFLQLVDRYARLLEEGAAEAPLQQH